MTDTETATTRATAARLAEHQQYPEGINMSETIEPTTETGTALAVIRTALPTILAADQNDILGKLADKVKSFRGDISTAKGRDAIRSLAAEIASSKMTLVKLGKSLTTEWRDKTKAVNAECNIIEEKMDALKERVRAPLTEFENAEKARIAGHEAALQCLSVNPAMEHETSEEISAAIQWRLEPEARNWQEFHQRAIDAHAAAIATLRRWRDAAQQREEAAAELARLRAEEAERARLAEVEAQRKREEQIARDATLAAEAEAERKAQQAAAAALRAHQEAAEALAAAQRKAEEAAEVARQVEARVEASRVAAHHAELETMRKLAAPLEHPDPAGVIDAKIARLMDVYNREWEEFDVEASGLFAASSQTLKQCREESVRLAEEAAARKHQADADAEAKRQAAAVEAERRRVDAARLAEEAAAQKRARNVARQRKINGEVLADFLKAMSEVDPGNQDHAEVIAKAIIAAIAKGQVRHVAVAY